jgi:beta-glucosidase
MKRNRDWAIKKASELVSKMTVEERASQLRYDAPSIERLGINEYNWWNEGLHGLARSGVATVFPQAIGLAAMFDDEEMEKVGDAISTEARARYNSSIKYGDRDIYKGLTIWSPNINIFRDPRWGRGHETYGEDPFLTSQLGCSFVEGLQGKDEKFLKTSACAKHFAVHSGPEKDRHHFNAKVNQKDLWETYLFAFERLVKDANVDAVMGAYNRTNDEPCCGSNYLIKDVLRGKWEFEGHYVSDCWAVKDFHQNHKVTNSPEESVSLALKSGCDVNCGCTYQFVMKALDRGMISEDYITQAAIRLFTTRYLLGEFEPTQFDEIGYREIESKKHIELSLDAARKSVVLLKNDGILPLNKNNLKDIAVIGPNANNRSSLDGNYHGTSSCYITLLEGIQNELKDSDVNIHYSVGCDLSKSRVENLAKDNDRISEALAASECSDLIILSLGLDESLEGEEGDEGNSYFSGDKKDISLPQSQLTLLEAMIKTKKPLIVVLQAGSCIDLRIPDEYANAIIDGFYPGARGGAILSDIIFGKCSPSGKLPITFYKTLENMGDFTDYSMKGRTYRYVDPEDVLYPFGFGLTYNKLELLDSLVSEIDEYNTASISVKARNNGNLTQEEVLQIYISDESIDSPKNPSLCSFKRIKVEANTEKTYCLKIPKSSFETVDSNGIRKIRSNKFKISVGFSQNDKRSLELMEQKPIVSELILTANI